MQQEIIFGIERLSQILKESGVNNLFIVTGSHSYRSLNFKDMIENLDIISENFNIDLTEMATQDNVLLPFIPVNATYPFCVNLS